MDGIQVHRDHAAPAPFSKSTATAARDQSRRGENDVSLLQGTLRRRFWMVLSIAVPLAITASILVLKLPPVYLAKGEIEINPPAIDPELLGPHDPRAWPARPVSHRQLCSQPGSQAAQ